MRRICLTLALVLLAGCASPPGDKDEPTFDEWLAGFRTRAAAQGISAKTLDLAFAGVRPIARVRELDARQPEQGWAVWKYLDTLVSEDRVARGRAAFRRHRKALWAAHRRYHVPPKFIVAIWGVESDFGRNMGTFDAIAALATLAHRGRRVRYGRRELMNALRIIEAGHMTRDRLVGSWAAAMGQTQFIPSAYLKHAVDADGDGRRDLWTSLADVFASTANFLESSGWRAGRRWGREVTLPPNFDWAEADYGVKKTLAEWRRLGVRRADGGALTGPADTEASIIVPAGHRGPAFLIFDNFRVILRYNNSTPYALSVAHLADRIAGGGKFRTAWPRDLRPLDLSERRELQTLLNARGFDAGVVDGIVGPRTRAALRGFQGRIGVPRDGFATEALLKRLRASTAADFT